MYSIFAYTMSVKNPFNTSVLNEEIPAPPTAVPTGPVETPVPPAETLILGAN